MLQARGPEELGVMRGLAFRSPDELSRGMGGEPQEEFDPTQSDSEQDGMVEPASGQGAWGLSDAKRGFDEDEEDEDDKDKDEDDDLDDDDEEFTEEEGEEEGFDDDDDEDEDDVDLDDDDDDE